MGQGRELAVPAQEIRIGGGHAAIHAVLRDNQVADQLASLTEGYGGGYTTLAYWDGAYEARAESVTAVTRTGASGILEIELSISPPPRQQEYSFNGLEYADATRLAVEVSWFGRENPTT